MKGVKEMINQPIKICNLLLGLLILSSVIPSERAGVQAAFYKYVDKNGTIHFTDRLEAIPKEYRNQINIFKDEEKPKPGFPKKERITEEQDRKIREAEEKKKAEAKALQDKSAREEKVKEEQEIQNQIAGLQDQIRGRQEEQKSLRTTWMVNDRNRLKQLNQEIAALEQEVRSLQQKLGGEK